MVKGEAHFGDYLSTQTPIVCVAKRVAKVLGVHNFEIANGSMKAMPAVIPPGLSLMRLNTPASMGQI
jgi:hypothetical protein